MPLLSKLEASSTTILKNSFALPGFWCPWLIPKGKWVFLLLTELELDENGLSCFYSAAIHPCSRALSRRKESCWLKVAQVNVEFLFLNPFYFTSWLVGFASAFSMSSMSFQSSMQSQVYGFVARSFTLICGTLTGGVMWYIRIGL